MSTPEAEIHLQDDDRVLADYTIYRKTGLSELTAPQVRKADLLGNAAKGDSRTRDRDKECEAI
jgi:hypothetical protein